MGILQLADHLQNEADAYKLLEDMRWGDQPVCPHCGSVGEHYFLNPANGKSRKTRTGAASERRVWKCAEKGCRKQFSVLTGTIFHGTKIPIRVWLLVIFDACSAKNGISAREVERKYGLTPRTAWHMMHRLREAMKREPIAGLLSGRLIADETWYGGKPKNRHGHDPKDHVQRMAEDKVAIMALVSRETGEVRSQVVPNVRGGTLRKAIAEQADLPNTHLHTDALRTYRLIADSFASHSFVNHDAREYVRDGVTTEPRRDLLLAAKAVPGWHSPPREPRAP